MRKRRLGDARVLFYRMVIRDEVLWNTMISGYPRSRDLCDARNCLMSLRLEMCIRGRLWCLVMCRTVWWMKRERVFDKMLVKNSVSWNVMIAGYLQCKRIDVAKDLFDAMYCKNISSWPEYYDYRVCLEWIY